MFFFFHLQQYFDLQYYRYIAEHNQPLSEEKFTINVREKYRGLCLHQLRVRREYREHALEFVLLLFQPTFRYYCVPL